MRSEPDARTPLRSIYPPGLELTQLSEGFEPRPYNDVAKFCTIAYGHLISYEGRTPRHGPCDRSEPKAWWNPGMTRIEGSDLLVLDMRLAQIAVARLTTVELTDGLYAALCDFVFNVGRENFASSSLLKSVNAKDLRDVPYQFRRWIKAGGREHKGLVTRREREIQLFFEGLAEGSELTRSAATPRADDLIDIRTGEAQ